jgi:hypothetical protein
MDELSSVLNLPSTVDGAAGHGWVTTAGTFVNASIYSLTACLA